VGGSPWLAQLDEITHSLTHVTKPHPSRRLQVEPVPPANAAAAVAAVPQVEGYVREAAQTQEQLQQRVAQVKGGVWVIMGGWGAMCVVATTSVIPAAWTKHQKLITRSLYQQRPTHQHQTGLDREPAARSGRPPGASDHQCSGNGMEHLPAPLAAAALFRRLAPAASGTAAAAATLGSCKRGCY